MTDHLTGNQFSAYIDDQFAADQKEAMEAHLDACASCTQEVERFQQVKIRFSRLPKRAAPPRLLAQVRAQWEPRPSFLDDVRAWMSPHALWRPAVALTAVAIISTAVLVNKSNRDAEFVDLDSLLVAHSKYEGESLVPHPDISQSNYSARLAAFFRENN